MKFFYYPTCVDHLLTKIQCVSSSTVKFMPATQFSSQYSCFYPKIHASHGSDPPVKLVD